ncbi:putative transcription regulator mTERF family [Helianthus annuus]|uniref:Transcription regulator mTERF family n=1 Tax=Helianthus annuus TaxID=4232 RepID=A0A9K3E6M6_HELAN|nr:putative transcription regulator mTERF family [Helianthus annuus]KAJ0453214.1 putative transcription regulator mTERF family [Helianthus annuus]KAJ0475132.1 putative transcription regulator mTERF family [Helianthus annuus]KAJ0650687.1 putative transcription regulator mTERF family [Helianthus annuus]KAJ0654439.1 putative transcription regulator mTERF family [Helianthus annuus]
MLVVLHASVVVELVPPVVRFLRGLDVEKQDIGYVLMKYPELSGFKIEGTMSTLVAYLFLLGRGISVEDVAKMIVKCPQLLALMKNSFYFFKSEMGRPLKELVEFPEYFTYGLESRIKPKYQRLQHKGIGSSLSWFLNCSDQRFEERLYADYIEIEVQGQKYSTSPKAMLRAANAIVVGILPL